MATLFNFNTHVKLLMAFDFPSLSSNRADPSSSLRLSRAESVGVVVYVPPVHRRRQHRLHPVHSPAQLAHLSLLLEEEPIDCLINCPNGAQLGAVANHRTRRIRAAHGFRWSPIRTRRFSIGWIARGWRGDVTISSQRLSLESQNVLHLLLE